MIDCHFEDKAQKFGATYTKIIKSLSRFIAMYTALEVILKGNQMEDF